MHKLICLDKTANRVTKAAQPQQQSNFKECFYQKNYKTSIIVSYKDECLVTVIKPENVASSNNIQHILKIVIFNKFLLGV